MAETIFTKDDYELIHNPPDQIGFVCENNPVHKPGNSPQAFHRCRQAREFGNFLCEECYQALPSSATFRPDSAQRSVVDGEGGLHRDGDKARLADMLPGSLLIEAGLIWAQNNQPREGYPEGKYPDLPGGIPNFKGGIRLTKYIDSMLRHLLAMMQGIDQDADSGFNHSAHLLCNLSMYVWTLSNHPNMDDREKPGPDLSEFSKTIAKLWGGPTESAKGPEAPV